MPVVMTADRFEQLVADALDRLPPEFTKAMDNVVVLTADRNEDSPHILGLYHGIALTRRTSDYGAVLPDRIFIYREPILALCDDEATVIKEVLITVVHEVAHHFGISDERLHELGWA